MLNDLPTIKEENETSDESYEKPKTRKSVKFK